MSFIFDKLFQKQDPELAGEMAKRGLIWNPESHRWVKKVPGNRGGKRGRPPTSNKKKEKSEKRGRPPEPTSRRSLFQSKGRKWKIGKRIKEEDTLAYVRSEENKHKVYVVLPETIEGTASLAIVQDFSGEILAWVMKHHPLEEVMDEFNKK